MRGIRWETFGETSIPDLQIGKDDRATGSSVARLLWGNFIESMMAPPVILQESPLCRRTLLWYTVKNGGIGCGFGKQPVRIFRQ